MLDYHTVKEVCKNGA